MSDDIGALLKSKREDFRVEIRKKQLDDMLTERRVKSTLEDDNEEKQQTITPEERLKQLTEGIKEFIKAFVGGDDEGQLRNLKLIRKAISIKENAPLKPLIESEVPGLIIQLLDDRHSEQVELQHEAVWIVTNMASGPFSKQLHNLLIQEKVIERLIHLMDKTPSILAKRTILWGLSNMAGESFDYRDIMIQLCVVEVLMNIIATCSLDIDFCVTLMWFISNLSRGKPFPPEAEILKCFSVVRQGLMLEYVDILRDGMWALSYMSEQSEKIKGLVASGGLIPRITKLILHENQSISLAALRCVGNMTNSIDAYTDELLQNNILDAIHIKLQSTRIIIRRESCWCVSNILAGTHQQISKLPKKMMIWYERKQL
eukprot:TRINITY_DN1055_c0_g1_i3.p1 TRINITY_DN1055_c0_g1~~TRINITY_DN1055_c0_g1_i3.p1  ORF type:complete len:372 (+),score=76.85 TRINITY_DN1055_c0_g1_i3:32-1147(+)